MPDATSPPQLSVIVPALNEAAGIVSCLQPLQPLRACGHEVIVVDGGSEDATMPLAEPLADRVLTTGRGRARQMNTGARSARGDVLLFLHADTLLPPEADRRVLEGLARSDRGWGRFDLRLTGRHLLLRLTARLINLRSRLTGIATGDQAIFVRRDWFEEAGGFPEIPLMEDLALSRALKRRGRPLCLRERVTTSSRRWEERGILRTILLMWRLRLAYYRGADPHDLARRYR
ncbi:MAG TPA: TIGR04283 family arsenosugar biosynthesis glycosyltransferase [Longimicrobiaceae bacterium]|nr:TIGR04283 family arsenosugar biosynthesis glycosyltransferase [Longimicrobiaceae bacterium]